MRRRSPRRAPDAVGRTRRRRHPSGGSLMLDPRVDQLAEVLIRHSLKLQAGEKVLLESYDAPPEVVAALVRRIGEAGALPLVETRHNRVLRALYQAATEEQMRLIGELELARMKRMDAYIGLRGADNATELADVP